MRIGCCCGIPAKELQEAIARGDIQVETLGEKVVVNFTPTEAEQKDFGSPQLLQETLNAIDKAKSATVDGKSRSGSIVRWA